MKALLKSHLRQRPKRTSTQTRCVWQWTPLVLLAVLQLPRWPTLARAQLAALRIWSEPAEACPEL
jgi:hypothetical protein